MYHSSRLRNYVIFLVAIIFLAVEVPIILTGQFTKPVKSDVMIVLGSRVIGQDPGPMLRPRLDETVRLYKEGYAEAIIVSGAKGHDEELSEAFVMKDYLIKQGVPSEGILTEEASFNTYQNLVNSKIIMDQRGFKTALIVSSSSHIRRALALAKELGMEASGAPASMTDNYYLVIRQYLREGVAMATLAFR